MRYADWVLLDIDGVQRGEVYLEITYYSNAPPPQTAPVQGPVRTPVAATLAPSGGGPLKRRPSKFPAVDRLARPASYNQVPAALKPSVPGNRVSPRRDQNLPTPAELRSSSIRLKAVLLHFHPCLKRKSDVTREYLLNPK